MDGKVGPYRCRSHSQNTGFPTNDVKPKDYLYNKSRDEEIAKEVKVQFGIDRGNRGIVINDIND
jgi:hypothetical protein